MNEREILDQAIDRVLPPTRQDRFDRMENRAPIPAARVTVTVRCVACKHTMDVGPSQMDVPMCPKCFSPMVAVRGRVS